MSLWESSRSHALFPSNFRSEVPSEGDSGALPPSNYPPVFNSMTSRRISELCDCEPAAAKEQMTSRRISKLCNCEPASRLSVLVVDWSVDLVLLVLLVFFSPFLARVLAELRPTADWRHHRCVKLLEITFLKNTTPQATHHGPGPWVGFSTKPESPERPDLALGPDNLLQGLVCSGQVGREHDGLLRKRCGGGRRASGGVCVLAHCGETLAALSCNVHQVLETSSASFRSATEDCVVV